MTVCLKEKEEIKKFNSEYEMFEYLCELNKGKFDIKDISIDKNMSVKNDNEDTEYYYICVNRFGCTDFVKTFGDTRCIGLCFFAVE